MTLRALFLHCLLVQIACAPAPLYVRDVKVAPSGALVLTRCEMVRDFWGQPASGECHTDKAKASE